MGVSLINQPFWGTLISGNPHICPKYQLSTAKKKISAGRPNRAFDLGQVAKNGFRYHELQRSKDNLLELSMENCEIIIPKSYNGLWWSMETLKETRNVLNLSSRIRLFMTVLSLWKLLCCCVVQWWSLKQHKIAWTRASSKKKPVSEEANWATDRLQSENPALGLASSRVHFKKKNPHIGVLILFCMFLSPALSA